MCKTVAFFNRQLTNSCKCWKTNKKTAKMRFYLFWQPQIDNIRTAISLYEAEIQENLDLLEEFINDVQYKN